MKLFWSVFILSFVAQFFLPWWSMMIIAFLFALLFGKSGTKTFFTGALACGLTWLVYSFYMQFTEGNLMTTRMATLFQLPSASLFFVVVFLLAAITGGIASWTGWTLRTLTEERKSRT